MDPSNCKEALSALKLWTCLLQITMTVQLITVLANIRGASSSLDGIKFVCYVY